jgi:hypothetical protein
MDKHKRQINNSYSEVVIIKILNSGAMMGLDLIRKIGITYLSVEDNFMFESCTQKAMNFQIASLITKKDVLIPARSSQSVRFGT